MASSTANVASSCATREGRVYHYDAHHMREDAMAAAEDIESGEALLDGNAAAVIPSSRKVSRSKQPPPVEAAAAAAKPHPPRRRSTLKNLHRTIVEQEDKEPVFVVVVKWILIVIGAAMLAAVVFIMGEVIYAWMAGDLAGLAARHGTTPAVAPAQDGGGAPEKEGGV